MSDAVLDALERFRAAFREVVAIPGPTLPKKELAGLYEAFSAVEMARLKELIAEVRVSE
jgi:hypothetical protein